MNLLIDFAQLDEKTRQLSAKITKKWYFVSSLEYRAQQIAPYIGQNISKMVILANMRSTLGIMLVRQFDATSPKFGRDGLCHD